MCRQVMRRLRFLPLSRKNEVGSRFRQGHVSLEDCLSPRSTDRPQRKLDSEALRCFGPPVVVTDWRAAGKCYPKGIKFPLSVGLINNRQPVGGLRNRPWIEQTCVAEIATPPQTGPSPIGCVGYQVCAQRVAFDITNYPQKVMISLHGVGFEAPLVHRTGSGTVAKGVPPTRMRTCEPVQKSRYVTVAEAAKDEMPMVWHEAVRKEEQGDPRFGFDEQVFERCVIVCGVEQPGAFCPAVHGMEHNSLCVDATSSWHVMTLYDWQSACR
jgi:hypothetical protein